MLKIKEATGKMHIYCRKQDDGEVGNVWADGKLHGVSDKGVSDGLGGRCKHSQHLERRLQFRDHNRGLNC